MASTTATKIITPKGRFEWVFITGEGKKNKRGIGKYQCSLVMDEASAKPLIDEIEAFWKANAPKGARRDKCNTMGYRKHSVRSDEVDEYGDPIYKEDGLIEFFASTGTTWPDGKPRKVKTYNAKGKPVELGDRKVGNGSEGKISAIMDVYDVEGNYGVNLYLDAIQLSKFVEFSGETDFGVDEDAEDGFDGFEEDSFEAPAADEAPKVRL